MDLPNPFAADGVWYRGNLHAHSISSDGVLTPEALCGVYRAAGYDFLAITDHGRVTIPASVPDGLLCIPGAELNAGPFHLVALNLSEPFDCTGLSRQEMIDLTAGAGATPLVCHPYWSGITSTELLSLREFSLMEMFNLSAEHAEARGCSSIHWDELLQTGRVVFGAAVDDCHRGCEPGPFSDIAGSWVMVRAKELSVPAVCEALSAGMFYSSTGVTIEDVRFDGKTAWVRSSPVDYADFISYNGLSRRISGMGRTFTEVECTLRGREPYLRIALGTRDGARAWTNPLFVHQMR